MRYSLRKAAILPMFDDIDVIYKIVLKRVLNRLDLLHHSVIRVPPGEPLSTHCCDLFKPVGRLSLYIRLLPLQGTYREDTRVPFRDLVISLHSVLCK